ncbi:MAG: hypothetical protein H7070_12325 [Saprospiraceae bacterium]|nr:hypothetical protein [Pyrinomonadaceae bacterium]
MLRRLIILSAVMTAAFLSITAQSVYTPEKGSVERTAIMNALRIPVERDLKQRIVFAADHFKVQGNWAYLSGTPQTTSGGRPNYRNTKYWDAVDSGAFDHNFFALLKKTGGKWKVTVYAIGCTDVCFADWPSEFKAPKAIFPYMGE